MVNVFNSSFAAKSLLAMAISTQMTISASSLSISDFLQDREWNVVDSNNQPVSESDLEIAHRANFETKLNIDNVNEEDKAIYTRLAGINLSVNDVVSSCLGKKTTVANGGKLTLRKDLTNEQREKIFKAAIHLIKLGAYENKWEEYYIGSSISDDIVYVTDSNTIQVGKAAIANGHLHTTRLLTVDNSNATQSQIDAFVNSDKKSQLYFQPLTITMQDNVVCLSVSNILNTAKKKATDYERRFQNTTMFYWDLDENDEPKCFFIIDTLDLTASGTRVAGWILEDTLEGGNAAARAGSGFLSTLF